MHVYKIPDFFKSIFSFEAPVDVNNCLKQIENDRIHSKRCASYLELPSYKNKYNGTDLVLLCGRLCGAGTAPLDRDVVVRSFVPQPRPSARGFSSCSQLRGFCGIEPDFVEEKDDKEGGKEVPGEGQEFPI